MKICIAGISGHAGMVIEAAHKLKNIEFAGYCATYEGEKIELLEESFKSLCVNPVKFDDYYNMIDQVNPDIVVIDSMFCDHAKMAVYALKKNIHVYCEKPIATNLEQYKDLKNAVQESKGVLWAMLTQRYENWFYTAKRLLQKGVVGKIRMVNGQKSYKLGLRDEFYKHRETYGGTIPWVAIHSIDMILWMTGKKCENIFARHDCLDNRENGDLEITSISSFQLEDHIIAHVNADYYRPGNSITHGDDRIRVVGTEGILEVRDSKLYLINNENDGTKELELQQAPHIFEDFVCSLLTGKETELDSAGSLYSTYIALLARQSADNGALVVVD